VSVNEFPILGIFAQRWPIEFCLVGIAACSGSYNYVTVFTPGHDHPQRPKVCKGNVFDNVSELSHIPQSKIMTHFYMPWMKSLIGPQLTSSI
jgi:hypothetical protein